MVEELTRDALLQQNREQAAQIASLIEHLKAVLEENGRLKKRIEQLEQQVKRYVAPHSRETPKADPKPPGRRARQGTFELAPVMQGRATGQRGVAEWGTGKVSVRCEANHSFPVPERLSEAVIKGSLLSSPDEPPVVSQRSHRCPVDIY